MTNNLPNTAGAPTYATWDYGEGDAFDLAAAYAFGLVRDHPFVDGNKRTAYVTAELFLMKHYQELRATDTDAVMAMLQFAEGRISEDAFAAWLREKSGPL